MTTLYDFLLDMVTETEERLQAYADKDQYPMLSDDEKSDIVENWLEQIKVRLIG